jgi:hypothetical protein
MTDTRGMLMGHQGEVKHKSEYLEFDDLHAGNWICGRRKDGTCEASGPCPSCEGTAFGPRTATIVRRVEAKTDERVKPCDVPCECRCGHDHGGGEDVGCGRWWIFHCPIPKAYGGER